MLKEVERRLGYELTIYQGSYNAGGVAQSAGTHDGGGAVDVWAREPENVVRVMRQVGFAAWIRNPEQGDWNWHIHGIAIADKQMSAGAASQVRAYYAGLNGLANGAADYHWRPSPIPVFEYWRIFKVSNKGVRHQFMTNKPVKRVGVKRIQRALNSKLNAGLKVDGIAGPATRSVYKRWEEKLGYKEPNGIPNKHSLRKLGVGIFSVK